MITADQKRAIVQAKIAAEEQKYYSHSVDAKVAQDIGGDAMQRIVEAAKRNMATSQKVIDALNKLLEEVKDEEPGV